MTRANVTPRARGTLAAFVEARRAEAIAGVLSAFPPAAGDSGLTGRFVGRFLTALSDELRAQRSADAGVWETAEEPGLPVQAILERVCTILSDAYAGVPQADDGVATYLQERLAGLRRRAGQGRRSARDEAVASLLSAVERRDAATCVHSRAVGEWCGRLAAVLGASASERADALDAGTLHDVGKIATPVDILSKAGPLNGAEWVTMRLHSGAGAEMVERIPSLARLAPIVRSHHEREDGRGYPDGLSGDAIPTLARIVAVADSFHAMITRRPYREPLSVVQAYDELTRGIGTQWHAGVVAAMQSILAVGRRPAAARRRGHSPYATAGRH